MRNALCAALLASLAAPAMADVGISVNVSQPGFYGQINLGSVPQPPQVIYAQPVVIQRTQAIAEPIYLRVPPGHEKHWAKHCREYNACGRPVYFVREDWYNREYAPRQSTTSTATEMTGIDHWQDHEREHERDHGRDYGRDHDRLWARP